MEVIDYKDLYFIDIYGEWKCGSFGSIRRCELDGKKYVCKTFFDDKYLDEKRKKIDLLSEINDPGLYIPKFWVKHDDNIKRYLCEFMAGLEIHYLKQECLRKAIKLLKDSKNLILLMHGEGIIHSDLSLSNIMYQNGISGILDFDNSSYKGNLSNIDHVNKFSLEYIKKYGINKELDIFSFNLLTFNIINRIKETDPREEIYLKKYGFFDNNDGIKICDSLFLDDNVPNKDFLIDTIDETKIKF